MPTAGQVCAGHTHAPRLEGKSSCPAGGTSPKGKAKAKGGLPLPDSPSKAGFGVSPLWRGTHLKGTLQKSFSCAFRLRFQAQRNLSLCCSALCGIVCHAQPFGLHASLPEFIEVCVLLHVAMTRVLSQQNRTYTVHALFMAGMKQPKEAVCVL